MDEEILEDELTENSARIQKVNRVRTVGGRRKAFRNIFRKNRGLIGNVSISLMVGAVIVFGAASTGSLASKLVWFVAATALLINLSREIIKDCQDLHADEGRDTLPASIGLERSRMIAYVIALAGLVTAALPYYIDLLPMQWLALQIPAILLIITTNGLLSSGQDQKAQKSLRIALLFGLLGFASSVALS